MVEFAAFLFIVIVFLSVMAHFVNEYDKRKAHDAYWRIRREQIEWEKEEVRRREADNWIRKMNDNDVKDDGTMREFVRLYQRERLGR